MAETSIERAARAYYIREQFLRTGMDAEAANALWDDADTLPWRELRISSMSAAIAEYEKAKAEGSVGKRERAVTEVAKLLCPDTTACPKCRYDANDIISAYERVMAEPGTPNSVGPFECPDCGIRVIVLHEPDAAQPRKEETE